jgi:hypothetical protein
MAEMRASPVKSKTLKRLADIVRMAEDQGQMEFLPFNPMTLFPVSSTTLENLAYGNLPMAIPSQSNIPITKTGRKQEVAELAGLLPMVPPTSRGVTQGANYLGDVMTQAVTRNPQATSMRALSEISEMSPVSQMFDPRLAKRVIPETTVVDEAGNPRMVYHGTGSLTDEDEAIQEFQTFNPAWFGEDTSTANLYAHTKGLHPTVYPSYLDIKKPLEIKVDMNAAVTGKGSGIISVLRKLGLDEDRDFPGYKSADVWQIVNNPRFMEAAMDAGFDGIAVKEGGKQTYGAFDPSQIKSATSDPDIMEQFLRGNLKD